jgi:hypothetical protein
MTDNSTFRPLVECHTPVGVFRGTVGTANVNAQMAMTLKQASTVIDQNQQGIAGGHTSFLLVWELTDGNRLTGRSFVLPSAVLKSSVLVWTIVEEQPHELPNGGADSAKPSRSRSTRRSDQNG